MLVIPVTMEDWRKRLLAAVDADERSDRALSVAAGLGVNFVNELRTSSKASRVDKVLALAKTLNLSLGHVFSGFDLSAEDEADLSLFLSLSPESRKAILVLAQQIVAGERAEAAAPAPQDS